MALTPIFWARVFEKHGSRGLLLALVLAFVVSMFLYVMFYYVVPYYFEISDIFEVISGYAILLIGLIVFFLLYWKFVVKKK